MADIFLYKKGNLRADLERFQRLRKADPRNNSATALSELLDFNGDVLKNVPEKMDILL